MKELSDEQLMSLCKNENISAFEILVNRWEQRILKFVIRNLRNFHEAEDVTQEVFISVYKARSQFSNKSSFKNWLYKIASNASINSLRKRKHSVAQLNEESAVLEDTQNQFIEDEKSKAIAQIISHLPELQRNCLLLHRFEGFSYEEISETLDLTLPSVKSNIHRAYETLKSLLEEHQPK